MSCERHKFLDTDDRVFCTVCGDPPSAEQLAKIIAARREICPDCNYTDGYHSRQCLKGPV